MLLPKNRAEVRRVSLYEDNFYFRGFAGTSQGFEAGNGAEEEASGACWEKWHHLRKRDQSFPIARGQAKANELASSAESMETANRRPAPAAGSVPLQANSTVTGEQAAAGSRQPGPPGEEATCAAVLTGPVAPSQPVGPLKPTAMDSDSSEPGVSIETTIRRMSSDMTRPKNGLPDGTTSKAQVANACPPARVRPNKTPIFISGISDTRSFLAWLRAFCPGGKVAQLKGEQMMIVPSTADWFRAAVNYMCHRPTAGDGTAILFRRGVVHHLVPVPGLTHSEPTAIQVTFASKSVLILAA